jgi:hypothetical protein
VPTCVCADFDKNVFINCPFDPAYKKLFDAMVFTVLDCGFIPRCALEISDSGETRIQKLLKIIADCKFGIHDLSRTELDRLTGLPRFNMPLELGLFLGAKAFGNKSHKQKQCIILDTEKHRYEKFISDIAGQDISSHGNTEADLIATLRDWLVAHASRPLPGGDYINRRYRTFKKALPEICQNSSLQAAKLTFKDRVYVIREWGISAP